MEILDDDGDAGLPPAWPPERRVDRPRRPAAWRETPRPAGISGPPAPIPTLDVTPPPGIARPDLDRAHDSARGVSLARLRGERYPDRRTTRDAVRTAGPAGREEPGRGNDLDDVAPMEAGAAQPASRPTEPTTDAAVEPVAGLRRIAAAVASAESLALAGVLVAVSTFLAAAPVFVTAAADRWDADQVLQRFATAYGVGGVLAATLGALAVLRSDPHCVSGQGPSSRGAGVVRACAGAAVLLGTTLALLAVYLLTLSP